MRQLCFLIVLICSVCLGCSSNYKNDNILSGFWEKKIVNASDIQKFVLYFSTENGDLKCQFHSYSNEIKFSSERGSNIEFDGESLSFIANQYANVLYEGKVDSINGVIVGNLKYADGSERDFDLKKISEENLTKDYPGLLALTKSNKSFKQLTEINDGWITGSVVESEIDSLLLKEMVESINNGQFGKVHSVLIARNGKLVFEKYFDGFFINDLNSLQSCTKSIGSLLIGLAIDNGFIENVDQKVIDFFPNYRNEVDQKWNDVELKHLLTMSVGLDWERNFHDRIYETSDDVISTTFEQRFLHKPGELFEYRNPQSDLLSGVIINSSNQSVQDFAKKYLFEPLNINKFNWDNFKNTNYPLMSGSLALTSRAMLKIGQLVLDKGMWNGKQIVSENWINESTSFKIATDQMFGYGYLWWLTESQSIPGLAVVFAMGIAGQHIVIIPEKNTVIVTTADNIDKEPEFLLKMIDEFIIKSIR